MHYLRGKIMGYKCISVCLDNGNSAVQRLDFALALAAQHGAHLKGVHVTYEPVILTDPYEVWAPILLEWEQGAQKRERLAREQFAVAAGKAGVSFDWVAYRSFELQEIIAHARASDLTILGRDDIGGNADKRARSFADLLLMQLGRPVLLLPPISKSGSANGQFDSILVAWNGSREAARAMADAMPFLRLAQQVRVVTIVETIQREKDLPDVDIGVYLAKHGVRAELDRVESIDTSPSDCLLPAALKMKADLLVMGAYGHKRWSELIMGGMTRSVMQNISLPVLMSH
jgi:nucleotide-binding universal stress UspA family protein